MSYSAVFASFGHGPFETTKTQQNYTNSLRTDYSVIYSNQTDAAATANNLVDMSECHSSSQLHNLGLGLQNFKPPAYLTADSSRLNTNALNDKSNVGPTQNQFLQNFAPLLKVNNAGFNKGESCNRNQQPHFVSQASGHDDSKLVDLNHNSALDNHEKPFSKTPKKPTKERESQDQIPEYPATVLRLSKPDDVSRLIPSKDSPLNLGHCFLEQGDSGKFFLVTYTFMRRNNDGHLLECSEEEQEYIKATRLPLDVSILGNDITPFHKIRQEFKKCVDPYSDLNLDKNFLQSRYPRCAETKLCENLQPAHSQTDKDLITTSAALSYRESRSISDPLPYPGKRYNKAVLSPEESFPNHIKRPDTVDQEVESINFQDLTIASSSQNASLSCHSDSIAQISAQVLAASYQSQYTSQPECIRDFSHSYPTVIPPRPNPIANPPQTSLQSRSQIYQTFPAPYTGPVYQARFPARQSQRPTLQHSRNILINSTYQVCHSDPHSNHSYLPAYQASNAQQQTSIHVSQSRPILKPAQTYTYVNFPHTKHVPEYHCPPNPFNIPCPTNSSFVPHSVNPTPSLNASHPNPSLSRSNLSTSCQPGEATGPELSRNIPSIVYEKSRPNNWHKNKKITDFFLPASQFETKYAIEVAGVFSEESAIDYMTQATSENVPKPSGLYKSKEKSKISENNLKKTDLSTNRVLDFEQVSLKLKDIELPNQKWSDGQNFCNGVPVGPGLQAHMTPAQLAGDFDTSINQSSQHLVVGDHELSLARRSLNFNDVDEKFFPDISSILVNEISCHHEAEADEKNECLSPLPFISLSQTSVPATVATDSDVGSIFDVLRDEELDQEAIDDKNVEYLDQSAGSLEKTVQTSTMWSITDSDSDDYIEHSCIHADKLAQKVQTSTLWSISDSEDERYHTCVQDDKVEQKVQTSTLWSISDSEDEAEHSCIHDINGSQNPKELSHLEEDEISVDENFRAKLIPVRPAQFDDIQYLFSDSDDSFGDDTDYEDESSDFSNSDKDVEYDYDSQSENEELSEGVADNSIDEKPCQILPRSKSCTDVLLTVPDIDEELANGCSSFNVNQTFPQGRDIIHNKLTPGENLPVVPRKRRSVYNPIGQRTHDCWKMKNLSWSALQALEVFDVSLEGSLLGQGMALAEVLFNCVQSALAIIDPRQNAKILSVNDRFTKLVGIHERVVGQKLFRFIDVMENYPSCQNSHPRQILTHNMKCNINARVTWFCPARGEPFPVTMWIVPLTDDPFLSLAVVDQPHIMTYEQILYLTQWVHCYSTELYDDDEVNLASPPDLVRRQVEKTVSDMEDLIFKNMTNIPDPDDTDLDEKVHYFIPECIVQTDGRGDIIDYDQVFWLIHTRFVKTPKNIFDYLDEISAITVDTTPTSPSEKVLQWCVQTGFKQVNKLEVNWIDECQHGASYSPSYLMVPKSCLRQGPDCDTSVTEEWDTSSINSSTPFKARDSSKFKASPPRSTAKSSHDVMENGLYTGLLKGRGGVRIPITFKVSTCFCQCPIGNHRRYNLCICINEPYRSTADLSGVVEDVDESQVEAVEPSLGQLLIRQANDQLNISCTNNQIDEHVLDLAVDEQFNEDYQVLHALGQGSFGFVRKATHRKTLTNVVVKFIQINKMHADGWVTNLVGEKPMPLEAKILFGIAEQSPFVITLLEYFHNEDFIQLVFEDFGQVDLFDFIDFNDVDENLGCHIFAQVLQGVKFLHDNSILHRDIKDENILINRNFLCKIIDFGSAVFMKPKGQYFTEFRGTKEYISPEVSRGEHYEGPPQDMYALGVLLHTICFGSNPFMKDEKPYAMPEEQIAAHKSTELTNLILQLLEYEPDQRIQLDDALTHPFITRTVDMSPYSWKEMFDREKVDPATKRSQVESFTPNFLDNQASRYF